MASSKEILFNSKVITQIRNTLRAMATVLKGPGLLPDAALMGS